MSCGVPHRVEFSTASDTGVRSAAFLASSCIIWDFRRRCKTGCITLFAGNAGLHLQIGDFRGSPRRGRGSAKRSPAAPRAFGYGMDGVLRNRAGTRMVVRARREDGRLVIPEEYRGLTAAAHGLCRSVVCGHLRGFRLGFADWACCGASGERERRIPGARRARGEHIDTALMRRARGTPENARRALPMRSCGGVFVRGCRRLCRTKPGCRPCVTREGEARPCRQDPLLRRIGGAGARSASLPGLRGFRFEIEDCGFYGAPGEFAGESRSGTGRERRHPRGAPCQSMDIPWMRCSGCLRGNACCVARGPRRERRFGWG